jgi:hypothetical protein
MPSIFKNVSKGVVFKLKANLTEPFQFIQNIKEREGYK